MYSSICNIAGDVTIADSGATKHNFQCNGGGSKVTGNVKADNIQKLSPVPMTVTGDVYYSGTTGLGSAVAVGGTQYPNSTAPASCGGSVITDAMLDNWKNMADTQTPGTMQAGLTACPPGPTVIPAGYYDFITVPTNCHVTFSGPVRLNSITVNGGAVVTTNDTLYVMGDVNIMSTASFNVSPLTYIGGNLKINSGANFQMVSGSPGESGVFIVGGQIKMMSTVITAGLAGDPNSILLLISRSTATSTTNPAIFIGSTLTGYAYAKDGMIVIQSTGNVGGIVGWGIKSMSGLTVNPGAVDLSNLQLP